MVGFLGSPPDSGTTSNPSSFRFCCKAWEFYERFCAHLVTLMKADGEGIVRIAMTLRDAKAED